MVSPRSRCRRTRVVRTLSAMSGVEARGALVDKQHLGVVEEGLAQVEAGLLSRRERTRDPAPRLGDLEEVEELRDLPSSGSSGSKPGRTCSISNAGLGPRPMIGLGPRGIRFVRS